MDSTKEQEITGAGRERRGMEFTAEQLAEADAIIAATSKYQDPGSLIPVLEDIQEALGYLPKSIQERVAKALGIPFSEVLRRGHLLSLLHHGSPGDATTDPLLPGHGLLCARRPGQSQPEQDHLHFAHCSPVSTTARPGVLPGDGALSGRLRAGPDHGHRRETFHRRSNRPSCPRFSRGIRSRKNRRALEVKGSLRPKASRSSERGRQ